MILSCDFQPLAEGEDITMYILLKTDDEKILAKQVKGAEAAIKKKNEGTVSTLDQVRGSSVQCCSQHHYL